MNTAVKASLALSIVAALLHCLGDLFWLYGTAVFVICIAIMIFLIFRKLSDVEDVLYSSM